MSRVLHNKCVQRTGAFIKQTHKKKDKGRKEAINEKKDISVNVSIPGIGL